MTPMNDAPSSFAGVSPTAPSDTGAEIFKKEKASWYREVLEVEPGSKIFLPYSRLLSEMGETDEAVGVLRAGLIHHPEFTEARLFLINLLHQTGDSGQCGAEVARLASLFCRYPDFWDAWSNFSSQEGDNEDFAVSLGILGALIRDKNISLIDVLSSGLNSLRQKYGAPVQERGAPPASAPRASEPAPAAPAQASAVPAAPQIFAEPPVEASVQPASVQAEPAFSEPAQSAPVFPNLDMGEASFAEDPGFDGADTVPFVFGENGDLALDVPRDTLPLPASFQEEDGEALAASEDLPEASPAEKCSLRTRSMAEVLAEQGDIRSAVDIYEELLAVASPEDTDDLQTRLESLKARMGSESVTAVRHVSASSQPKAVASPPGNGVLDLLERLAVRLETKARQ